VIEDIIFLVSWTGRPEFVSF